MDTLAKPLIIKERLAQLKGAHVQVLHQAVENELRSKTNLHWRIPTFDPADGGTNAEVLFILEAPGPQTILTGFVSRDNPDATARKWSTLLDKFDITRKQMCMWNICPNYICNKKGNVRKPLKSETDAGYNFIANHILPNMKSLKLIVLVGKTAKGYESEFNKDFKHIETDHCDHPSQVFINQNKIANNQRIENAISRIANRINGQSRA